VEIVCYAKLGSVGRLCRHNTAASFTSLCLTLSSRVLSHLMLDSRRLYTGADSYQGWIQQVERHIPPAMTNGGTGVLGSQIHRQIFNQGRNKNKVYKAHFQQIVGLLGNFRNIIGSKEKTSLSTKQERTRH